jgi:ribokinase
VTRQMTLLANQSRSTECDVCVVGNLNTDLILRGLPHLPGWGTEVAVSSRAAVSSGQAGYLAMALAALGVRVDVVANVGPDAAGEQITQDLQRAGVGTGEVEEGAAPTGLTVALVREDGERAFVTEFGCLSEMDESLVSRHAEAIGAAQMLCLVGLFMLPSLSLEVFTGLAAAARRRGQFVAVDPGWDMAGWPDSTVRGFRELAACTDLLLVNNDEAEALTGTADHEEAASVLLSWGPETIVIKRGALGAYAVDADASYEVPALQVEVADAVGAGDSFNAGFIAVQLSGGDVAAGLSLGAAVAGVYCSRSSERFPSRAKARAAAQTLRVAQVDRLTALACEEDVR